MTRGVSDLALGPRALAIGFGLIFTRGIRIFVIMPLLINIIVFVGAGAWLGKMWQHWVEQLVATLPAWLQWLQWLAWIMFAALLILVFVYGFTLLANLISAPFNGFLSQRVERYYGGQPDSGLSLFGEFVYGVRGGLHLLLFTGTRALLLALASVVLFFIPGLNALIPLLWLVFGAYMLALQYFDYPMSNHGYELSTKRRWLRENRILALSFGGCTTVLTALPLINLLIMPAAIAGATALWVERARSDAENKQ